MTTRYGIAVMEDNTVTLYRDKGGLVETIAANRWTEVVKQRRLVVVPDAGDETMAVVFQTEVR